MSALGWQPNRELDLPPCVGFGIPPNSITFSAEGYSDTMSDELSIKDNEHVEFEFFDESDFATESLQLVLRDEAIPIDP
jgi:hypothetical protein